MSNADWAAEASAYSGGASTLGAGSSGGAAGDTADRTAVVAKKLKEIYSKAVLPVEKRFQYDYFYESPFLSDVEFDGKCYMNYDVILS